jgi:hypothetical protein
MTAINTICTDQAVHICTDGASYLPDGRVMAIGTKVFTAPNLPMALAVRGPAGAAFHLGPALTWRQESFDGVVCTIEETLPVVFSQYVKQFDCGGEAEIILTGWSEYHGRCAAYFIRTHDWTPPATVRNLWGREHCVELTTLTPLPFRLVKLGAFAAFPSVAVDDLGERQIGRRMLQVMEAQRALDLCDFELESTGHVVGGFAQLTTITRDAISQRIIHRWPDRVGMKIAGIGEQHVIARCSVGS